MGGASLLVHSVFHSALVVVGRWTLPEKQCTKGPEKSCEPVVLNWVQCCPPDGVRKVLLQILTG